jgi:hypothetical protein
MVGVEAVDGDPNKQINIITSDEPLSFFSTPYEDTKAPT